MASIRRPARIKIPVGAGREVAQRVAAKFINDDEAVITSVADERDLLPIGRPLRLRVVAPREGQRFGFGLGIAVARNRRDPDLLLRRPHRKLAVRRYLDVLASLFIAAHVPEQTRLALVHIRRPHLLHALFDVAGRVGDFSSAIRLTAPRVDNGPSVGRQLQRGNRHAIVAHVVCNLPGLKIGSVRDPHVTLAPSREHPCDSSGPAACIFGSHKIRWKWRTHNLFQREGVRRGLRGTKKWRGTQQQYADARPAGKSSNSHARQST